MTKNRTIIASIAILALAGCEDIDDAMRIAEGKPTKAEVVFVAQQVEPEPSKPAWSGDEHDPQCWQFRISYCSPEGDRIFW